MGDRETELLALLSGPPSATAWRALCRLLDAWEPESLGAAIERADAALASWPDALRTTPRSWVDALREGRDEPRLALARVLRVPGPWRLPDGGIGWIPRGAAWVRSLTGLELPGGWTEPTERSLADLLGDPALAGLRRLSLTDVRVGPGVATVLAGATHLAALRELRLDRAGVDDAALAELMKAPHLRDLKALSLRGSAVTAAGVARLARAGAWPALRRLDLSGARCGVEGAHALASAKGLACVEALSLQGCEVGAEGLDVLLTGPGLASLAELDLARERFPSAPPWVARRPRTDRRVTVRTRGPGFAAGEFFVNVLDPPNWSHRGARDAYHFQSTSSASWPWWDEPVRSRLDGAPAASWMLARLQHMAGEVPIHEDLSGCDGGAFVIETLVEDRSGEQVVSIDFEGSPDCALTWVRAAWQEDEAAAVRLADLVEERVAAAMSADPDGLAECHVAVYDFENQGDPWREYGWDGERLLGRVPVRERRRR